LPNVISVKIKISSKLIDNVVINVQTSYKYVQNAWKSKISRSSKYLLFMSFRPDPNKMDKEIMDRMHNEMKKMRERTKKRLQRLLDKEEISFNG